MCSETISPGNWLGNQELAGLSERQRQKSAVSVSTPGDGSPVGGRQVSGEDGEKERRRSVVDAITSSKKTDGKEKSIIPVKSNKYPGGRPEPSTFLEGRGVDTRDWAHRPWQPPAESAPNPVAQKRIKFSAFQTTHFEYRRIEQVEERSPPRRQRLSSSSSEDDSPPQQLHPES